MLPKNKRGSIALVTLCFIVVILATITASLLFTRSAAVMAGAVDLVHQMDIEQKGLEQIVRDALLQKLELRPGSTPSTVDSLVDSILANVNSTGNGVTLARATNSQALPVNTFYPNPMRPAITQPDLSAISGSYEIKSLLQPGAAAIGTLSWDFNRTAATGVSKVRSYTVTATVWSVPLTNFNLIAYGLPSSISGGNGIPPKAPDFSGTVISNPLFLESGARPLLVSTLNPAKDPTAFSTLYCAPDASQPEQLPQYYRPLTSLAWNAWEYVWSATALDALVTTATNVYDLNGFTTPSIAGVTLNSPGDITVDLSLVPAGTLALIDGAGGSTIRVVGGSSGAGPVVLLVRNPSSTYTHVILSGADTRTTLFYANGCSIAASGSLEGAIFLDRNSTISGTLSIDGCFAFLGTASANPFPALNLTLTAPGAAVAGDLASISPRAVVIATSSVLH